MNKKIILENKITFLIIIINVLFLLYFLILAYFSRPHYDDLHFLWKLKEMSIGDYIRDMYFSRSGRFFAYFLNGVVFKIIILFGEHRFFPILFGVIGFISFWTAIKSFFLLKDKALVFNSILFVFNLTILTNIDFGVFNWLCAMSYYWLGSMLLLLVHFICKDKLSVWEWLFFILVLLFLGGSLEAYTPIVMVTVFCLGIYYIKIDSFVFIKYSSNPKVKKIFISLIILFVSFIIVVIAPGNYIRLASDEFSAPHSLVGFLKGFVNAVGMFTYFQLFYIPYYFLVSLLFVFLGFKSKTTRLVISFSYKRLLWIGIISFGLYLFLSVLPSVYLWGGFGIQRNYTHVVFILIVFILFQAFLIGYFKLKLIQIRLVSFSLILGLISMVVLMTSNLIQDTKSASNYAASVDTRIEYLKELNKKGVTGIVEVKPLVVPFTKDPKFVLFQFLNKKTNPQPVLYYTADTEESPNEYSFHLKKVYGFDFEIQLSKQFR